jgi:hypothetical protein
MTIFFQFDNMNYKNVISKNYFNFLQKNNFCLIQNKEKTFCNINSYYDENYPKKINFMNFFDRFSKKLPSKKRISSSSKIINSSQNDQEEPSNQDYLNNIEKNLSDMQSSYSNSNSLENSKEHITWTVLNNQVIDYDKSQNLLFDLQNSFYKLLTTNDLNKSFDIHDRTNYFKLNKFSIYHASAKFFLNEFNKIFPDLEDRQLISSYVNKKILRTIQNAIVRYIPGITNFSPIHSHVNYLVKKLPDGNISLTIIYLSDLVQLEDSSDKTYKSFGMRAKCILFKNTLPIVKYSFFVQ